jgi:hypothetical protein
VPFSPATPGPTVTRRTPSPIHSISARWTRSCCRKNDIARTVADIEYRRRVTLKGGVFTAERTERGLMPKSPAKDAPAAQATLRDQADQMLYNRRAASIVWRARGVKVDAIKDLRCGNPQYLSLQFNTLCWTKAIAGLRLDSALADCDRALALSPKFVASLDSKGLILLRLSRTENAIAA